MMGGIPTNVHGQALRIDQNGADVVIPGLYACGLDIDSVFSGFYPGAGSMHGPNITFAFVAAEHLVKLSLAPRRVAPTVEAVTEQE